MPTRTLPEKFKVAFSFAGEQRDLVRAVAEAVEKQLGSPSVFLDEWFEHYITGPDAYLKLQEIYSKRSELVVVCVSERYGGKTWIRAEHAAIWARTMEARESGDKLGVLPVRVGVGDVKGIRFNKIVPDIRGWSPDKAANFILDRLRLILPDLHATALDWPEQQPTLKWPVAGQTEVRSAFERLLTRTAPWRFLPILGPSESGKSCIARQLLRNVLGMPDIACGYFDFKGTIDMDAEVRSFVRNLDVPLPSTGSPLNESLSLILDALKQRNAPALLIFDTYEAAGEGEEWVEKELLRSLSRNKWLRVVITGQKVPNVTGTIWEGEASPIISLKRPSPADWYEYAKQHRPEITLEFVEAASHIVDKPSILGQLFGPTT